MDKRLVSVYDGRLKKHSIFYDTTIITGDINFAQTNWDTFSSTDTFESHVLDVFIEDGFQQILKDSISGRSLHVILTNNKHL